MLSGGSWYNLLRLNRQATSRRRVVVLLSILRHRVTTVVAHHNRWLNVRVFEQTDFYFGRFVSSTMSSKRDGRLQVIQRRQATWDSDKVFMRRLTMTSNIWLYCRGERLLLGLLRSCRIVFYMAVNYSKG
ncbi:hypothetical protein F5Y18DRAFT_115668 [Xylariaceae sp. FL1019]|nr:hypothetical protein F5Y18DRAFT_115668 [Xylariaceae sp. FL1019]